MIGLMNYNHKKNLRTDCQDLGLFISAIERASGVAYGEADHVITNKLITLKDITIKRGDIVDYPHGLVQTILHATRLLLMGEPLSLSTTQSRIEYIFKERPAYEIGAVYLSNHSLQRE